MRNFKATGSDIGARADVFVSAQYPRYTRSSLAELFDNKLVRLNGEPLKPSYKLREGDLVTVEDSLITAEPLPIDLEIIYEDDNLLVINKPSGILTHSKGALNNEATVASFIKPKLSSGFEDNNRAGIVHRLDRGTSGVIATAKTPQALKHLQKQFSARKTKKQYLAIVEGRPEPAEALIDAPIARNPRRPQTFYANAIGKPAQTEYKLLNTYKVGGKTVSLVRLRPLTGRTHQIRVHLAYAGHPVVGDPVYGYGGGQLMLHAAELELTVPGGQRKVFIVPEPVRFKEYLADVEPI